MMEAQPIPVAMFEPWQWSAEFDPSILPPGGLDLKDHLAGIEIGSDPPGARRLPMAWSPMRPSCLRVQRTTLVEKLRKYGLRDEQAVAEAPACIALGWHSSCIDAHVYTDTRVGIPS